jgi:hypothetical protein
MAGVLHLSKTHLVIPDPHAHPDHNNQRFKWLGELIKDVKPDVVVNMGDHFDLASLSSYDKGKASFHSRSYERDIESGLEAHELMWGPIKKTKKKMPYTVVLEGNHEHRIKKALEKDPELGGSKFGISFKHFGFEDYYDDIVEYSGNTPGLKEIDGITYSHYMVSGLLGKPISGEHHGHSLLAKYHSSCTVAHSHTLDYCVRSDIRGNKIMGCVAGVYQDYNTGWAGAVNNLWTSGVVLKTNVEDGVYDFRFISIESLRKEYDT